MGGTNRVTLRIIDVGGGVALAACAGAFLWAALPREDRGIHEVRALTGIIEKAAQERRNLLATRDRQSRLLEQRRAELAESGQLPARAPVEQYFQVLSAMSARNGLRVVKHNPLAALEYPGLLEQRYAYEVVGSFPDLLRFLRAIEQTDYWADVSYLKLDRGVGPQDALAGQRTAALTISLFAASAEVAGGGGGT